MNRTFVPSVIEPEKIADDSLWFGVQEYGILVIRNGEQLTIPWRRDVVGRFSELDNHHYLGSLSGTHCYAVEIPDGIDSPSELDFQSLRRLYGLIPDEHWVVAGRALQVIEWDRTHQFCGRCGTPTPRLDGERAKRCPNCGLTAYPRISPAVITLVYRGNQMLLARSTNFPDAFYSVLAGFVEPGESLEETVTREIYEEAGINVKDIAYFGSQPWPFPHSLMIGFTAAYAGGEIVLEDDEIIDAGWFSVDDLPRIPGKLSIARSLIDWFIEKQG